jgi:hypothetical protein
MRGATIIALLAIASAGCASGKEGREAVGALQADPLGAVPDDLSVELNVWPLPGRYVLFADGSLHWEAEPGRGGLPPLRRVLRRAELAEVWPLVEALGPESAGARAPILVPRIEAGPEERIFLGTFLAGGRRWSVLERPGPGAGEPAGALVAKLDALAWVDPAALAPKPPRRDDFGPDPYARYRR